MAIQIASISMPLYEPAKVEAAKVESKPKVAINVLSLPLSETERAACEKLHVDPETYIKAKEAARRNLNPLRDLKW